MDEVKCDICGSILYKVVYHIKSQALVVSQNTYKITHDKVGSSSLRIVRCLKCGLVYVNPQDSIENIYVKYRDMIDEDYFSEEKGRRIAARIIFKKISKYNRKGRILDIGCATGFLLDEAKNQGWEVYGVELSRWACKIAREKFNLNVFDNALEEIKFPDNYFDAIVLLDSIEHLPDPVETLINIRGILKSNGVLCISTPDINSLISRLLKAKWWGIQQSHLYYFSKKTLVKLLDVTGFKIMRYSCHERVFSVDYWSKRLKNYNKTFYQLFRFIAKYILSNKQLLKINFRDQIEIFAKKNY